MPEMASWFETPEGYIHLTDEDIIAYHEQDGAGSKAINWDDYTGHGGLIKVFHLKDEHHHHEGFVRMPDVIKKQVFNGKMDMMFAHSGNLNEATPEFIPTMVRLAKRFKRVADALKINPYKDYAPEKGGLSLYKQMQIGIENNFVGSTIGEILRSPLCDDKTMILAMTKAKRLMDEYTDHHHYRNIVENPSVSKVILKYLIEVVKHPDVSSWAEEKLKNYSSMKLSRVSLAKMRVKTVKQGKALVRSIA